MGLHNDLPGYMEEGADNYIRKGIRPGGFLYAVLSNNFKQVIARADSVNMSHLKEWFEWLCLQCPDQAQGCAANVEYWISVGGLEGLEGLEKIEQGIKRE